MIAITGFAFHLRPDHVTAAIVQLATMYLLFMAVANACSIHAPFAIPSGTLKGTRPNMSVILAQLGFAVASPVVVGLPAVIPVVVEIVLVQTGVVTGMPVSLGLSVAILAATVWCYRRILTWEGRLLAAREQQILEVVTGRKE